MFCLGKCLSETKCKSFQGAAISGYKKIRTSLLNVTLSQLKKRMANEKDVRDWLQKTWWRSPLWRNQKVPVLSFNTGFLFGCRAEGKRFESLREVALQDSLFWQGRQRGERERERELVGAEETAQNHAWEACLKPWSRYKHKTVRLKGSCLLEGSGKPRGNIVYFLTQADSSWW